MSLLQKNLSEIHTLLEKREISALDLVNESIQRIEKVEPKVGAFLTLNLEKAKKEAEALDQKLATSDSKALLTALPVGVKDNICTEGLRTTCASQLLANYEPIYNATVIDKLKKEQAIIIGKMNMDEFAMGSSTENSGFHLTYNPWDLKRVPGGSSGGSAAAVAAGEVYFAIGSDTGGSIRQPAAYCGVVGLKPTYGRVSRYGLVAYASSLDQVGPLTKNVEDAAYVLQAIAGHDPQDSTSANVEVPNFIQSLTGDIRGLKVAVPKELMGDGIDPGVRSRIQAALAKLEELGAKVEEVSLPHLEYAIATYYLLSPAEASSNLARFDGVRYGVRESGKNLLDMYKETRSKGLGPEVKRRIMLGTYALSSGYYDAYYLKAQKVRTLIRQDFDQIFADYDVIVGPTTPTVAFEIGSQIDDLLTLYANDVCTIPVNLAGLPAISVPCGLSEGLPVGLQIIGKAFDEATILRVAHAYESSIESIGTPKLGGIAQ